MQHNEEAKYYKLFHYFHYLLIFFGVFLLLQGLIAENCKDWSLVYKCVKYADEAFVISSFIFVAGFRLIKEQPLLKTGIEWPLSFFLLIAIISSVAQKVPPFIVASQFVLYIKGFLLLYIFANLPMNKAVLQKYVHTFLWVTVVIFALGVVDFAAPNWFRAITGNVAYVDYRAGIPSIKSLFIHPGIFGWFMSFIALFVLSFFFVSGKLRYFFLSILFSYGVVFSMRRKAILGLLAGAGLLVGFGKLLKRRSILFVALFCLFLIVPNYNRMYHLFSSLIRTYGVDYFNFAGDRPREKPQRYKVARNALYFESFKIAGDCFPLGAGLGRYGSWMSRVCYSPLYEKYKLSGIYGLSRDEPHYINDTFWPMVLGETGFIGLTFYAAILLIFVRALYKQIRNTNNKYIKAFQLGTFMVLVESLVESIASPVYVGPPKIYFIFGSIGICYSLSEIPKKVL